MPTVKRNLGLIVSIVILLVVLATTGLLLLNPPARRLAFGDNTIEYVGHLRRITLRPGTIIELDEEGSAHVFIGGTRVFPQDMESALYSVHIEGAHAIGCYLMRGSNGRDSVAYTIIDGDAGTITRITNGSAEAAQAWKKLTGLPWPDRLRTK